MEPDVAAAVKLTPERRWPRRSSIALEDGVEDIYPGDVAQEWLGAMGKRIRKYSSEKISIY